MARGAALLEIDDTPEADRLDGFPHPRECERLYGHVEAERMLAEALHANRLHHAWLIAGREGIGKATLAYGLARFAFARPDERGRGAQPLDIDPDTIAARQVRALSHPGLIVLRRPWDGRAKRFAAAIPVDEVRRLRGFLGHTADAGQWRVVIVDRADELNNNAANALLKSLEEPPPRTVFLLISAAPGKLPPTVRSRCRRLALAPLASADLRKAAEAALAAAGEEVPAEAEWQRLEPLARGSVRALLNLGRTGGVKLYESIAAILAGLPRVDWQRAHALADELTASGAEQRFETFFDMLLDQVAGLIRAEAMAAGEGDSQALGRRLAGGSGGLASWAELWETVVREKADMLALNLDKKGFVLETLARLEAAAKG
jgi:DNA polymerase-3 subunit delta'